MNEERHALIAADARSKRTVLGRIKEAADGIRRSAIGLMRLEESINESAVQLARLEARIDQILVRTEDLPRQSIDLRSEQRNELVIGALLTAGLSARRMRTYQLDRPWHSEYAPAKQQSIEAAFAELQAADPVAYPVWRRLFENGKRSYYEQREASCSHRDHWYAKLFGAYVDVYSHGRLLDIGCGPHGVPSYLLSYDPSLISGLEPLPATTTPNVELVQGFNERLPWPDKSFHTVVSGTSLDHVLSIERSLAEVSRVLVKGGRYLVWLASIPGAPPYIPTASPPIPVDDFHLFHFDRVWIEPIFERWFRIIDVTVITQSGFDHVFYCMVPLK
ncbi:MAG: class I SAM-dependent methyltransferase [Hyphomicrobiaceae bacterium]